MLLFLSTEALAQGGQGQGGDPMITMIMFGGFFVIMYFMLIRPQRKRQKEHQETINALGKGDEVVMNSGMLGKITGVDDDYISVEAGDGVKLKFQKAAVHAVLPKGTIKNIA